MTMTTTTTRRPKSAAPTSSAPALPEELLAVLKRMRLPYLRDAAPEVLATARAQRWDPAEVLRVLITEEIRGRDDATRRMRRKPPAFRRGRPSSPGASTTPRSHPALKPGSRPWNGSAEPRTWPSPDPAGPARPTSLKRWRTRSSTSALRVSWFTLESLTAAIGRATVDGSVAKTIARITRAELIVIDDIGMLPAGQAAGEAFYRVVDAAYERRSIAVTSNLHPSGFDTIMPKTLATATVDRLLHHAHVVLTEGTSLRLSEATAGRGVVPLA